ncbi:hypothetical protein JX266_001635 [Neoarthrinium moseri]|uniref:uncharacterized protein n=1 Tax=Neoarthrinium moseri TaxID=1658444 RepID=UPI001FDDEDBE|nr:uncharacterized protein JN550_006770 [Neoarthrinium moseri]KAI1853651.1 hypothetical protein JX266_001635 [Neoarthrinium moseri]KAI1867963.1 hypothetical protein JN550_006770 [Neoarthrinium moseri]
MPLPAAPVIVYVAAGSTCITSFSACVCVWRSTNAAVQTLKINIKKNKIENLENASTDLREAINSLLEILPTSEAGRRTSVEFRKRLSDAAGYLSSRMHQAEALPQKKQHEARLSAYNDNIDTLLIINNELGRVLGAGLGNNAVSVFADQAPLTQQQPERQNLVMSYDDPFADPLSNPWSDS